VQILEREYKPMRKTALIIMLISISLVFLSGSMLFAYDSTAVEEDMQNIAQSFSDLFGKNVGSISMIGDPIGYSTIPHFEIGLAGGAVFVPLANLNSGNNIVYSTDGMGYTPVPSLAAHAKITVRRFEFGGKLAGIPPFELSNDNLNGEVQSMVIGAKLRYRLVDKKLAVLRFGVSAGGFYEFTSGTIGLVITDSFAAYEDVNPMEPGEEHVADLVSTNAFNSEWRGHTVGGEVQGNIKILFINLFAGARMSNSWGSAQTSILGAVDVIPVPEYAGDVTADPTEDIDIDTEASPDGLDYYAFGGIEAKILPVVIGGRMGYNFKNEVITFDLGARLQF
jgi:hypothetical protein